MVVNVFVSHSCSDEDHALVEAICTELRENEVEPYVSDRHPEPGRPLEEKLREAVSNSDAVIVIWTQGGHDSQWVNQEVGMAKALGKIIIPFVEAGVKVAGVLAGIEYAKLNRDDPRETAARIGKYLTKLRRKAVSEESSSSDSSAGAVALMAVVAVVAIVAMAIVAVFAIRKGKR